MSFVRHATAAASLFSMLALLSCGCTTSAKSDLIERAMANDKQRHEAFEATARALDKHPEYVDEFYQVARRHPATMNRFLADTDADLNDPSLANATAERLVVHPDALKQMLISTIDAARTNPQARAAIDSAILQRSGVMSDILTDEQPTVTATVEGTVRNVEKKGPARAAFLGAMRKEAPRLAEILSKDPDTLLALTEALLRAEKNDKAALQALVKKLGLAP